VADRDQGIDSSKGGAASPTDAARHDPNATTQPDDARAATSSGEADESPARAKTSEREQPDQQARSGWFTRLRRKRLPGFLTPTNAGETAALITVSLLVGAVGLKGVQALTKSDPWNERADRVCLDRGNQYVSAAGDRLTRQRGHIRATEGALNDLKAIQPDVPTAYALGFNSMLDEKREQLRLLKHELALLRRHKPVKDVEDRLLTLNADYSYEATQIDLNVCGQGTGQQ
jgi:hypothetical protein